MTASTSGLQPSRLFFVTDRSSGLRFLVDTGAEVSVLPVSRLSHSSPPAGPTLQAVNHSTIATFGSTSRTINLGLRRTFRWVFLIADVKHPILGADFLHNFNLLVDIPKGRLIDSITHLQVNGVLTAEVSPSPSLPRPVADDQFTALLQEFPALTSPVPKDTLVKHSVMHHIVTTGPPVHARPRRLPPERLHVAKGEFDHMMELGIVRPSRILPLSYNQLPSPPQITPFCVTRLLELLALMYLRSYDASSLPNSMGCHTLGFVPRNGW